MVRGMLRSAHRGRLPGAYASPSAALTPDTVTFAWVTDVSPIIHLQRAARPGAELDQPWSSGLDRDEALVLLARGVRISATRVDIGDVKATVRPDLGVDVVEDREHGAAAEL